MKYTFKCPKCKVKITLEFHIRDYEQLDGVYCDGFDQGTNLPRSTNKPPFDEHFVTKMYRVFTPTRVVFRGEGFTGAGGIISKMDKTKRKKDLSKDSGVEI